MEDIAERTALLREAVTDGGNLAQGSFRQSREPSATARGAQSSAVAERVETSVTGRIRRAYASEPVYATSDATAWQYPTDGCVWVLDPLSGATDYDAGNRVWSVSLACLRDGDCLASAAYHPALDDLYVGVGDETTRNDERVTVSDRTRVDEILVGSLLDPDESGVGDAVRLTRAVFERGGDVRRCGSGQTMLAWVAGGELDAAVAPATRRAGTAVAGVHLVRCAGGRVTDLAGDEWVPGAASLVATNGRSHRSVLRLLSALDGG
jgi:myo-inositol-1(or 4)-monophosphatase